MGDQDPNPPPEPQGGDDLARLNAALQKAREERKAADDRRKQVETKVAELTAQIEAQKATSEQERANLRRQVLEELRPRLVEQAVIAAGARQNAHDPSDLPRLLDLGSIKLGDDGSLDQEAVNSAVSDLLAKKPHLVRSAGPGPLPHPEPPAPQKADMNKLIRQAAGYER